MKEIFQSRVRFLLWMTVMIFAGTGVWAQTTGTVQQVDPNSLPIPEQFSYVQEHTKIYENFRAVREDIFQRLKKNVADTINSLQKRLKGYNNKTTQLNRTIDSLNTSLSTTKTNLDEITRTKESISLLGMEVEKGTYNAIMWSIIIVLLLILLIGFLVFRRNQNFVSARNKDLADLRAEFEAYRKTSREAREKMTLQHFNELKKLRGE